MLYQIILKSNIILSDQEFENDAAIAIRWMNRDPNNFNVYQLTEARSLDGIREEVWKRSDDLSDLL